jgi:hypothetical protein
VLVTIDHDSLLARTGYGTVSDGTLISTERLLELADEAEIIPAVLNRAGAVLTLGRSRRIASRSQTLALVARDGGCSFPGCDRAPEWCERHHITAWIDGGATDLDNLTLLCAYHHHNFTQGGWTCTLNPDGLPQWTPPRWIDRHQAPRLNNRITAGQHLRRQQRQTSRSAESRRRRPPTAAGEPPKPDTPMPIPTPRTMTVDPISQPAPQAQP